MSSVSFVSVIIGAVFGVIAGIGARRRREGVLLAGFVGIIATIAVDVFLELSRRSSGASELGARVSLIGVGVAVLAFLVAYVVYLYRAFRKGVGLVELELCFALLPRRVHVALIVVLPLLLSVIVSGAILPIVAPNYKSKLTSTTYYEVILLSITLVVLGALLSYRVIRYIAGMLNELCLEKHSRRKE